MKKIRKYGLLLSVAAVLLAGGVFVACRPSSADGSGITCAALAPLDWGGGQGVSAPFAGRIGNALVVAGGCNFPGVPAAEGGEKVFYRTIYRLENPADDEAEWERVGELPVAAAYGVGITVPQGLVCIGGTDGTQSLRHAWLLRVDDEDGYVVDALPDLPEGIDNGAGAFCGGALYVGGGQTDGTFSMRVFRLKWPEGGQWEELPVPPGGARLQPVAIGTDTCFYLMGGFVPPSDDEPGRLQSGGCVYHVAAGCWSETAPLRLSGDTTRRALVGAVGALSPDGLSLLFAGGVNADRFLRAVNRPLLLQQASVEDNDSLVAELEAEGDAYLCHPVEWYRFSSDLLSYRLSDGVWMRVAGFPQLARAGAALVTWGRRWYVVNGESMPGIRSCDVSVLNFPVGR